MQQPDFTNLEAASAPDLTKADATALSGMQSAADTDTQKTENATLPIPETDNIPERIHASNAPERVFASMKRLCEKAPRIHCLTNVVTMNDVANILLAIGGSAIMAQAKEEAAQITALCEATLLNTGTPSDNKFISQLLAGEEANRLCHPLVLDPVGVGASTYRRENIKKLLTHIRPNLIRCNLEEAVTLLSIVSAKTQLEDAAAAIPAPFCKICHGGVESGVEADVTVRAETAKKLASAFRTTVLVSGSTDAVSDGVHTALITGGDSRITRITGSGCMLSAICAALLSVSESPYEAALDASILWKQAAECAGQKTDLESAGMGSFHRFLFDAATNLGCLKI